MSISTAIEDGQDGNMISDLVGAQLEEGVRRQLILKGVDLLSFQSPHVLTKYDSLLVYSKGELQQMLEERGISTEDCKLKYHYVSRIQFVDERCPFLKESDFPKEVSISLVNQCYDQLLSSDNYIGVMSKGEARELSLKQLQRYISKSYLIWGSISIEKLGTVSRNELFHNRCCLYPCGFHSRRCYLSVYRPNECVWYDCFIRERQGKPFFIVSLDHVIICCGYDINDVWRAVLQHISSNGVNVEILHIPNIGEVLFGLTLYYVQWQLEGQLASLKCPTYEFYYQRIASCDILNVKYRKEMSVGKKKEYSNNFAMLTMECARNESSAVIPSKLYSLVKEYCSWAADNQEVVEFYSALIVLAEYEMQRRNVKATFDVILKAAVENFKAFSTLSQHSSMSSSTSVEPFNRSQFSSTTTILPDEETERIDSAPMQREDSEQQNVPIERRDEELIQRKRPSKRDNLSEQHDEECPPQEESPKRSRLSDHRNVESLPRKEPALHNKKPVLLYMEPTLHVTAIVPDNHVIDERHKFSLSDSVAAIRRLETSRHAINTSVIPSVCFPCPSPVHHFSLLPAHLVTEALRVWDFFSTFSVTFQLPQVSYEVFEFSLCHPKPDGAIEQIMSIVLLVLFSQLHAVLYEYVDFSSVDKWKPFHGGTFHCLAWPELARFLFISFYSVCSGIDKSITHCFESERGKRLDRLMQVDPIRSRLIRNDEDMEVEVNLLKPDRETFNRSLALMKYLISIDAFRPLCKIPNCGLEQLMKKLKSGYFFNDNTFNVKSFRDSLFSVCKSHAAPKVIVSRFRELIERLYDEWILQASDNRRGPWDEIDFFDKPCKLCWEHGIVVDRSEDCVTCDRCHVSYHFGCVMPPLIERPSEWLCGFCRDNHQESKQNEWNNTSGNVDKDFSVLSPITFYSYPLQPLMGGTGIEVYDIDAQFDPCIISPTFFGYDTGSVKPINGLLSMQPLDRAYQLAKILAVRNPSEMSAEDRLAIISTVAAIAREYSVVRSEAEEIERSIAPFRLKLQILNTKLMEKADKLCKSFLQDLKDELDSHKPSDDSKGKRRRKKNMDMLPSQKERNDDQDIWTLTEIEILKDAVVSVGCDNWGDITKHCRSRLKNRSEDVIRNKWRILMNQQISRMNVPISCDGITITNLGRYYILSEKGHKSVYPVGFQSYRSLPSIKNPRRSTTYYSEVLNGGKNDPIFHVWNDEGLDESSPSSCDVWLTVLSKISHSIGEQGPSHVDGNVLFGFWHPDFIPLICDKLNQPEDTQVYSPFFKAVDVLNSMWHPACVGYIPDSLIDKSCDDYKIVSPIFLGHRWQACDYCSFCHLPDEGSEVMEEYDLPILNGTIELFKNSLKSILSVRSEVNIDDLEIFIYRDKRKLHACCFELYSTWVFEKIKVVQQKLKDFIEVSLKRYAMFRESELSVRTRRFANDDEGSEYYVFRGDKHRIYVQNPASEWSVIDDNDLLRRSRGHSQHHFWSKLAELQLDLKKAPYVNGTGPITTKHFEELPQTSSVRAVAIPELFMGRLIKVFYPQYFVDGRLNQCNTCGLIYLPPKKCLFEHNEDVDVEVRLARCLLTQLEMGIPPCAFLKQQREEWTPARRMIWQEQVSVAETPSEFLTLLFMLENLLKSTMYASWDKLVGTSMESQGNIRTFASFFMRLFLVDRAICDHVERVCDKVSDDS